MLGMNESAIDYSVALSWTFDSTPRQPRNSPPAASSAAPSAAAASAQQDRASRTAHPSPSDLRWQTIVVGILDVIARFPDAYEAVRAFYGGPLPEPAS